MYTCFHHIQSAGLVRLVLCSFIFGIHDVSNCQFNVRFDAFDAGLDNFGHSIEEIPGGYFMISNMMTIDSDADIVITRINLDGQLIDYSDLTFGTTNEYPGYFNSLNRISDSSFVFGGSIGLNPWLVWYHENGDTISTRLYETSYFKPAYYAGLGYNETIVMCGVIDTLPGDFTNLISGYATKLNLTGQEIWETSVSSAFYGVSLYNWIKSGIDEYTFGGSAYLSTLDGNSDLYIVRISSSGEILWHKKWGCDYTDGIAHLCQTSDGNIAVSSAICSNDYEIGGTHPQKAYIAKLDNDGEVIWESTIGPWASPIEMSKIIETSDGNLVAAGYTSSVSGRRGVLIKVDGQTGDSLWYRSFAFSDMNQFHNSLLYDVIESSDGCLVACGQVDEIDDYISTDLWVLKVDSLGCLIPGCNVGVLEQNVTLDIMIYPIPATDLLNIYLKSNHRLSSNSELRVIDLFGKIIASYRIEDSKTTYVLDVSTFPTGNYILQCIDPERDIVSKVITIQHR